MDCVRSKGFGCNDKGKREAKALLKSHKKLAAVQQKRARVIDESQRAELDNEINELENEVSRAEEAFNCISIEEAKDKLRFQIPLRVSFWKATLPSGDRSFIAEDWEGRADYLEVTTQYNGLARAFTVPSSKLISETLAELDRVDPDWDKTEPQRFSSPLGKRFPHLGPAKRTIRATARPGIGCLVVLAGFSVTCWLLCHVKLLIGWAI